MIAIAAESSLSVKTLVSELAALGGTPTFDAELHVGRPNIGDEAAFHSLVSQIFARKWLTNNGPMVQRFEGRLAELNGAKHCVSLANATIGLEVAAHAAGFSGEVIVPSFTFIATAHALRWQGITPVFCDVGERSHTIDPKRIEALITPRTTGIVGVHLWGRSCEMDAIEAIAQRYDLPVIYDAAHAFGCTSKGRPLADFGLATVLSFHATKFLNSFEGGAVLTNDDDFARRVRQIQNFGFSDLDQVDYVGTNGKMTEICAAMGLTSLDAMERFIEINLRNYQAYRRELSDMPGVRMIPYDEREKNNFQYIVLEIDEEIAGLSRDMLHHILQKEGVLARRYFYPGCHNAAPYRTEAQRPNPLLPVTNALIHSVLVLPTGSGVDGRSIQRICEVIRFAFRNSEEIRREVGPQLLLRQKPLWSHY